MTTNIEYPLYVGKFSLLLGYANGLWKEGKEKFPTLDELYEHYRSIRPQVNITGAKVMREDGTVNNVIF